MNKLNENQKKYDVVLTYGTFDLFHFGHLALLLRIKNVCNKLIVGVSTNAYNELKNKKSFQSEKQRFDFIKALPYVDKVIYENNLIPQWVDDYKKYHADAIIMGDDHVGELDYLKDKGLNIVYISRTKGISSKEIREKITNKKIKFIYQKSYQDTEKIFDKINNEYKNKDFFLILAISNQIKNNNELFRFWNNLKILDFIFFIDDVKELEKWSKDFLTWKKNNNN